MAISSSRARRCSTPLRSRSTRRAWPRSPAMRRRRKQGRALQGRRESKLHVSCQSPLIDGEKASKEKGSGRRRLRLLLRPRHLFGRREKLKSDELRGEDAVRPGGGRHAAKERAMGGEGAADAHASAQMVRRIVTIGAARRQARHRRRDGSIHACAGLRRLSRDKGHRKEQRGEGGKGLHRPRVSARRVVATNHKHMFARRSVTPDRRSRRSVRRLTNMTCCGLRPDPCAGRLSQSDQRYRGRRCLARPWSASPISKS